MKIDDVRKTVSNPKPLYFAAGIGDAAVEVLKDAPTHLNTLSSRAGVVATDVAGKVADTAETLQSRIALNQWERLGQLGQLGQLRQPAQWGQLRDQLGQLDPKALRAKLSDLPEPDLRAAREKAQTLLLQQVGWALEVAGKAVETYDEYSERGKGVVDRVLYGRGTGVEVVDVEDATRPPAERVVVERVTVVEPKAKPAPKPAEAPKTTAKAESGKTTAPKPAAAKPAAAKPQPAKAETPKAETPKAAAAKPEAPKPAAPKPESAKAEPPKPEAKAQGTGPAAPRRPAPAPNSAPKKAE